MTTVVAISRQFGAGGSRVGRLVAQRLGYRYADRDILAEAARRLGLDVDDLAPFEERVPGVWSRLGALFTLGTPDTPFLPPSLPVVNEAQVFEAERQIIARIAEEGRAVIVGRGAAHVLQGHANVFRVFLHAPTDVRVANAMSEYALADQDTARTLVDSSDRERARFVRTISGLDWRDASAFDLCMNTAVTGFERIADVIVTLVSEATAGAGGGR